MNSLLPLLPSKNLSFLSRNSDCVKDSMNLSMDPILIDLQRQHQKETKSLKRIYESEKSFEPSLMVKKPKDVESDEKKLKREEQSKELSKNELPSKNICLSKKPSSLSENLEKKSDGKFILFVYNLFI